MLTSSSRLPRAAPRNLPLTTFVVLAACAAWVRAGQPDQIAVEKDIVYGKGGDVELHLDLARPPTGDGPFPLVVCIHGGGWRGGNKVGYHGRLREFAKRGYVAAAVQYRFCPQHKFPAQIEDVKCAVRFLRAHAKEYKIDPTKVAAMGDSAGGHLSLLLGLMDPADGLEGNGGCADQSSKVQAVVNYFGPTDFTMPVAANVIGTALVADFLGTVDQKAPVVARASPITYVSAGDPPILTFQGTADPLVPMVHAKSLHEALKKAGVPEHLETIEGGGHGFAGPAYTRTVNLTYEFLDEHLKGKAPVKSAVEKTADKPKEASPKVEAASARQQDLNGIQDRLRAKVMNHLLANPNDFKGAIEAVEKDKEYQDNKNDLPQVKALLDQWRKAAK
ncbi:MAG: alpha/beta hydrolase [Planctomycetota bacterium]|nr:alpha/beta hydrolase [Planctomycetota bacterium]